MSWLEFVPLFTDELHQLGHFGDLSKAEADQLHPSDQEYIEAVESFQPFMGLDPSGELDEFTQNALRFRVDHYGNGRCCGRPDIEAATEEANIPNGTVTWPDPEKPIVMAYNFDRLPGLSAADTKAAYTGALNDINSKIGVNLVLGEWDAAHIKVRLKGLGGGTLAIALLSLGSRRLGAHYQNYDSSNRTWSRSLAQAVVVHETGHTLGYSHSNSRSDIMYPTASGNISTLQPGDVRRFQRDYGPSLGVPDVPDDPDTPDKPLPPGKQAFDGMFRIGPQVVQMEGTANVIG